MENSASFSKGSSKNNKKQPRFLVGMLKAETGVPEVSGLKTKAVQTRTNLERAEATCRSEASLSDPYYW